MYVVCIYIYIYACMYIYIYIYIRRVIFAAPSVRPEEAEPV